MAAKRLVERVQAPFAGARVDRAAGVIYGVKLCGFESLNGRDYLPEMFRRDFRKYENAPINFNHGRERLVENVGGRIRSPRVDADGTPRGDAHLLKSHPMYERVMESAEQEAAGKGPGLFGFSHVAMCQTTRVNGRERVEGMDAVESVDLVAQPATTRGFFEGTGVKHSLKQFGEAFGPKWGAKKWGAYEKLLEDIGDAADAPVMDDMPTGTDGSGDLKSALMAALSPMLDEAFESGNADKAVSALKDFIKLHAKHTGTGKDATAGDDDSDDDDSAGKTEGKKAKGRAGALMEAFDAAAAAGFTGATSDDIQIIANTIAAGHKPAGVIARLMKTQEGAGAEQPKSGGRAGAKTVAPTKTQESAVPADSKSFAARYRE